MRAGLLQLLRCPFCGDPLQLEDGPTLERQGDALRHAVLFCQCCAYPVVDGIPYLRPGALNRETIGRLQKRQFAAARHGLLGLADAAAAEFERRQTKAAAFTFREALQLLQPTAESSYFLYRFSDPTYLASESILHALEARWAEHPGWALDLGGGTGHLARCLGGLRGVQNLVLADLEYWKLWLAREFVAPESLPVCCDANAPLPFARAHFALAFCSDALNYVWQRRLLVSELARLLTASGALLVTHMHNALCENPSAGMPLTPAGYRRLFETVPVRLFGESAVLKDWPDSGILDLSGQPTDEELAGEASLFALATRRPECYATHAMAVPPPPTDLLAVNPLYRLEQAGPPQVWCRRFPDAAYEAEFAACKRYLPERFELHDELARQAAARPRDPELIRLIRQRVLLALPPRYC